MNVEETIPISNLNDFLFCPRSIYFHNVYSTYDEQTYHDTPQVLGRQAHNAIDTGTYATKGGWLVGIPVYSEELGISGRIDLFNPTTGLLVERKRRIRHVYEGQKLQVYAQYYCLSEMGYSVREIRLHSLQDNKKHPLSIPTQADKERLLKLIQMMRNFDLRAAFTQNPNKCRACIYRSLCDHYDDAE
jgi:CRISPR-associated protein Cas4